METPLELRLRQLVHRVDELHINLQKVSSKTLSNSRTTSLEDRLHTLEQGQLPEVEPSVSTQILDDLTLQMSIFEKRLEALEKKMDTYHKEFYEFQDYWFNEDEQQIVSTNTETIQTIKLLCDRQAVQIHKIFEALHYELTNCGHLFLRQKLQKNLIPTFPNGKRRSRPQMPQRHHPNDDVPFETTIPNGCTKQESQIPNPRQTPLVYCRFSFQLPCIL